MIRYATNADRDYLTRKDPLVKNILDRLINDQRIIIAETDSEPVGWLRFSYFWEHIPFVDLLCIDEPHRRQGIGRQLMAFWEGNMKEKGKKNVMLSSQAKEQAQYFYRKLGYVDGGYFTMPGYNKELIFVKVLQ